ncbi:ester cyclase [Methanosarcina sp.]|uniref:ester cyclase n=1 Tax=Methanosarcina sp. TaxID=2213 RepID=UPI003C75F60A
MLIEENKSVLRRFWEEVFNGKKLATIDELFAPDWVYHGAGGQEIHGPEELKQFLSIYFDAFPDFRADVEDLIAEGDRVASRATCYGTHQGELMGIAPTGRQVTVPVICISRLADNKIVEDFELVDIFGMLQQLGVNSPAEQR